MFVKERNVVRFHRKMGALDDRTWPVLGAGKDLTVADDAPSPPNAAGCVAGLGRSADLAPAP